MAEEFGSGVKFESKQAESNIDRFARKVGTLSAAAKEAKAEATKMADAWTKANASVASAGVNAAKAATGTLSFSRAAREASQAARGLVGALSASSLTAAARGIVAIDTAAKGMSATLRAAATATGSLATALGRAEPRAARLASSLRSVVESARSASSAVDKLMSSLKANAIEQSARSFGSLVGSFRAASARMGTFRTDVNQTVTYLERIGTGGTSASRGLDRIFRALDALIPKFKQAISEGQRLAFVLDAIGQVRQVKVNGLAQAVKAPTALPTTNAASSVGSINAAAAATKNYADQAERARLRLNGMADSLVSLRNVARFYITGLGITELAKYADTINLVRARLSILGEGYRFTKVAEQELQRVSIETRTGYSENAKLFVKLAQAGSQYGVTAATTLRITENVAKAFKVSGASAEEAANSTLQLGQAFSSGRLQGDELRSILENSPRLAQAFGEKLAYMGVNLGNIRQYAKEGKIGIEELVKVLADDSLTKELAAEFNRIPLTMADALVQTKNRLMIFIGELDSALGITPKVVAALGLVADNFENIAIAVGIAATAIAVSYIPNITAAIAQSRIFIGLNLATYGVGVAKSAGGMANAFKAVGGGLATVVTGGGLKSLGGISTALGGIRALIPSSLSAISNIFLRWPPLLAAASVGLVLFKSKFRPVKDEAATTSDYVVVAFSMAASKISDAFGVALTYIEDRFRSMAETSISIIDGIYRAIKFVVGTAIDAPSIVRDGVSRAANLATGGLIGRDKPLNSAEYKGSQYARTGVAEDVGSLLKGSELSKQANERALTRMQAEFDKKYPELTVLGSLGGPTKKLPGKPDTGGGKKSSGPSEADRLGKEYEALLRSIDPVEAARGKFNDGVKTLDAALKANILTTDAYSGRLKQLASDVFPDLAKETKDLTRDNERLQRVIDGRTKAPDKVLTARDNVNDQLDLLDKVIAKQGDQSGALKGQKDILLEQLAVYENLAKKNADLIVIAEKRAEKERQITELIDNAMNRLQEAFVSQVSGLLDGTRSFLKSILGIFKETFAQYLGNALFSGVREQARNALDGLFGIRKPKNDGIGIGSEKSSATSVLGGAARDVVSSALKSSGSAAAPSVSRESAPATVKGTGPAESTTVADAPDIVVKAKKPMGFLEAVGSGYTNLFRDTGRTLLDVFKPVGKVLGQAAAKLGISTEGLGKFVGKAFAGAQIGSAVAEIGSALGIKTSQTGGAIGGALGSLLGPIGGLVGGIVGSIFGGLFIKTPKASATVTQSGVGTVTGTTRKLKSQASAAAKSVFEGINSVAKVLGAKVGSFNVAIGSYKGDIRVNENGKALGGVKNSGASSFGDDAEAAVKFAVQLAIKQGAIQGLSETADRVLKTFKDLDRAVEVIATIKNITNEASLIRDPLKGTLSNLRVEAQNLADIFKEAGASTAEYDDLALVVQNRFQTAVENATSGLVSFWDSLKAGDLSFLSPVSKLAAANDKFSTFETKISSGDFNFKQEDFTKAGTDLQSLARSVFGSTPEFAAFQQRLIDATDKVISNAQATADAYKPVVDAIIAQTKADEKAVTVTNELLRRIAESMASGGNDNSVLFSGDQSFGTDVVFKNGSF